MRIELREFVAADLGALDEIQRDQAVYEMAVVKPRTSEAFAAHMEKVLADAGALFRVIVVDGEVAGTVGTFVRGHLQAGYALAPKFWARGVATEALRQALALEPRRPVFAEVVSSNVGSRRVLEKCGFQLVRSETEDDGVVVDVLRLS